jgi:ribosomal protein S18 acetylase RimI-like enzyme
MATLVPFNRRTDVETLRQFTIESLNWHKEGLLKHYDIDIEKIVGISISELADSSIESNIRMNPLEGIIYLLDVSEEKVGTGTISKIDTTVGEIYRMWVKPEYRGKGYGSDILRKLLEAGRGFGFSLIRLSTPRFAYAAQHIYKKTGFKEIEVYPDTAIPPPLRQYWIYMKKKL